MCYIFTRNMLYFFLILGKTKTIIKNDKLVKKKLPDYKVAYVTLVSIAHKLGI